MGYPIPHPEHFFRYKKKQTNQEEKRSTKNSYTHITQETQHIVNKINTLRRLRRTLPFIQEIYLCDSASFNASHTNSDIDICIITKPNTIRRARFFSVLRCTLLWLKRSKSRKAWKIDLVFYIDAQYTDLSTIALSPEDPYLNYWLAHLIPIYKQTDNQTSIYTNNPRIQKILPNFPMKHTINIGTKLTTWSNKRKKIQEIVWGNSIREYIISKVWKPRVLYKTQKHGTQWRGIIVNNNMLKFHKDIRDKVQKSTIK